MEVQLLEKGDAYSNLGDYKNVKKVAKEALSVLGYSSLYKDVVGNELEDFFRTSEITWFSEESVKKYKEKQRKVELHKYIKSRVKRIPIPVLRWIAFPFILNATYADWERYTLNSDGKHNSRGYLIRDGYKGQVPMPALEIATHIKKAHNDCEFYIDALEVHDKPRDPFLVCTLGDRVYYLAVWDEPSYKAEVIR